MSAARRLPPRRRRRRRPRYWLRRLVLLLLVLTPGLVWAANHWEMPTLMPPLTIKPSAVAPPVSKTEPIWVVLMGVDERARDIGRSDTMMLLRIDPKGERADVVSLPRDTRIALPDGGHEKLNAVYPTKGPDGVTRVVSQLLGVPRPYWVEVNMEGFVEIIDELGGVPMTLERNYDYEDPYQDLYIHLKAGPQTLNGRQALHFVRLRYDGVGNDDIGRIKRQQAFLQALQKKLASPSNLLKVGDFLRIAQNRIKTNIPQDDQIRLATLLFQARNHLQMQTLPGVGDPASGDWLMNDAAWQEVMSQWQTKR
jgi:LCP family protein required for cell wall assembly